MFSSACSCGKKVICKNLMYNYNLDHIVQCMCMSTIIPVLVYHGRNALIIVHISVSQFYSGK